MNLVANNQTKLYGLEIILMNLKIYIKKVDYQTKFYSLV